MSDYDSRAKWDALRSRAASTFTGSYQVLGTAIAVNARIMTFTNNTNQDVTVSTDGTTDNFVIPAGGFRLLDIGSNAVSGAQLYVPQGTQFYVKGASGTGTFYFDILYSERF